MFPNDRPVRADAIRNRELLLTTASRMFAQQGVDAVTMSAIAQEAGVGKGTLYRHFSDKAELCHALLDEAMRSFQEETFKRLRQNSDPADTLRWFVTRVVHYVIEHNPLLVEAAAVGGGEMLRHPAHSWWRQTILGLLQRLCTAHDASYLADVIYVMLDVRVINFQRETHGYSLDELVEGLLGVLEPFLG
ncbi:MAG: TetR/AcrR family transcriptional regulator [Anaerolineae bacterium]|nr:TetR/AcrR family transcriptional regulator [Anaerolineae bacterium]MCA9893381.1 TetR/AcrR family transcriptional regulator [Anaerolineae bacterium]MCB9460411.1 TetR/AcrR family transcriptional regulator [Anaerolineaceae bacterium]